MSTPKSGKVLWIGYGDLARKCKEAFFVIKDNGYDLIALDVKDEPVGLKTFTPDKLFLRKSKDHHNELVSMAKRDGFEAIYVANYGHQHISSAIEFQHYTPHIIIAKPLDTCLDFLLNINKDRNNFTHLLPSIFIHDHYMNKPGVNFLKDLMLTLHADHNFIESIKLFLVERETIENKEQHRIKSLECGMLFDLAVHMISILQAIIPEKITWSDGQGIYERIAREISVIACITAKDAGSLLGKSTVIQGREAETFGLIELKVSEKIYHEGIQEPIDKEFPVLIVVGKGVPPEQGITRDLKTIVLNFRSGAEIALDLDTYGMRGIDDKTLRAKGYGSIAFNQRGINLPLITAAQNNFDFSNNDNPFQPYTPALESIRILSEALRIAPIRPKGYRAIYTSCRELVNILLREDNRFSDWRLPENFGNYLIGTPLDNTIA